MPLIDSIVAVLMIAAVFLPPLVGSVVLIIADIMGPE